MFKDAKVLDSQRTASAFVGQYQRYAKLAEKWFDGSVGSVDRRLVACDRLLHSARHAISRMSVSEAQRYLRTAQSVRADRDALASLKEAMLSGGAGYEAPGPPGYREAKPKPPGTSAGSNEFEHPAPRTKTPRWMDESEPLMKTPKVKSVSLTASLHQAAPSQWECEERDMPPEGCKGREDVYPYGNAGGANLHHGAHWFKDDGSYAVPGDGGPHPSMYASPHEYLQARNMHEYLKNSVQTTPGGGDVAVDETWRSPTDPGSRPGPQPLRNPTGHNPYHTGALDGTDRRWVTLESAKFVAANGDALDDSRELATRAHNHAAVKTSTFTAARSAAVSAAFVEQVVDLGRRTYQPPMRVAAREDLDFAPEAIFVC